MRSRFAVLSLATYLAVAPAFAAADVPAPTIEHRDGTTIVRQLDAHSALVGVALVVRAGLDRQTMKQNGLAALVAQTILRTPVTLPASGL